ncbi:MAG: uroporphyrinogen-III C-methyltransferase [Actinomycetota bacterium]|nr:uroporphyrinogen-III C-methyltransferase [Actinomycetota bacterium]
MTRFPLHLDLAGRRVLVVGGGPVAARRTRGLQSAGAVVEVVARAIVDGFPDVPVTPRAFVPDDVDGAWLVLACTGVVDDAVAAACASRRIWCVRADDASLSDAWMPAVARVDDVVVSVTAGRDPRRAMALRDALTLAIDTGDLPLRRSRNGTGSVAIVGGGPGDPDLLTVKARRLIAAADVLVRDRLAPVVPVADGVEVVEVGKVPGGPSWAQRDIEALLVDRALQGRRVVRLKGGDVHVFARGMEEVTACFRAGVAVEVVPGLSSALAAPTYAGIPLTARGVTQSFTVVSGHLPPGDPGSTVDWDALARLGGTLVLLMAVGRLGAICAALIAGGRGDDTPVAVLQDATLASQSVLVTTLGAAHVETAGVRAPAVVVIGDVVGLRQ